MSEQIHANVVLRQLVADPALEKCLNRGVLCFFVFILSFCPNAGWQTTSRRGPSSPSNSQTIAEGRALLSIGSDGKCTHSCRNAGFTPGRAAATQTPRPH